MAAAAVDALTDITDSTQHVVTSGIGCDCMLDGVCDVSQGIIAAAAICVFGSKLISGLPLLLVDAGGLVAGLLIALTVPSNAGSLAMAAMLSLLSEGNVAAVSTH